MKIEGIGSARPAKDWSWSYSKLKNFEVCPRKHYEVDLAKTAAETQSDDPDSALNYGNRVHAVFKEALLNGAALPDEMSHLKIWVDRVKAGPGQLLVEQKYAINRNFQKTGYFAPDAWVRMIGDVVRIDRDIALVIDWKTGKIVEDSVQLMLMAQALFSHYPALKRVRSEFVWLKDDCTSPEVFDRKELADQWVELMPRVNKLEDAHKAQSYPPKPGGLCKRYCPVQTCPYWKKGA